MKIEKGFYYHYKHDPAEEFNNYAYEVIGTGLHTEDKTETVIYRPLYKNTYLNSFDYSNRPLDMFTGQVEKDGKTFPRFTKITDSEIILKLEKVKEEMYGF